MTAKFMYSKSRLKAGLQTLLFGVARPRGLFPIYAFGMT